ncbi:hypothetical protein [Nocardia sp. alder85J]|uniref:hypothetical protein n=1 Tax=Nocardia sp. alder85J TaxID=2862949 RepID=UPI001CD3A013|nr:hypothetical protein [Nocardia sp. alder85J]MCX4097190.1 hypothetical protein [Nocardia sp. alder85J]
MLDLHLPGESRLRPERRVFADAAFGARPGIAAAELPAATDAVENWLRAVILGGQGRYAAARAAAARVRRHTTDPVLCSLAVSTEASLWRQLGWHARAAGLDGRALALVTGPGSASAAIESGDACPGQPAGDLGPAAGPGRDEAVCDAFTGLAADALGTADPLLAARLLERCQVPLRRLGDRPGSWRPRLRWHWVAAETALSSPAGAATALTHAETAVALAADCPSVRHRVKSRLLLAAAATVAGDPDRARALSAGVAAECREHGLLPLRWACAMLRTGLGDAPGDEGHAADPGPGRATVPSVAAAAAEADHCARVLAEYGGRLRTTAELSR